MKGRSLRLVQIVSFVIDDESFLLRALEVP
jgi:hypothetical protein